jgi:hypothetical protein
MRPTGGMPGRLVVSVSVPSLRQQAVAARELALGANRFAGPWSLGNRFLRLRWAARIPRHELTACQLAAFFTDRVFVVAPYCAAARPGRRGPERSGYGRHSRRREAYERPSCERLPDAACIPDGSRCRCASARSGSTLHGATRAGRTHRARRSVLTVCRTESMGSPQRLLGSPTCAGSHPSGFRGSRSRTTAPG